MPIDGGMVREIVEYLIEYDYMMKIKDMINSEKFGKKFIYERAE